MKKIIIKYRIFLFAACAILLTLTYAYAQNAKTDATVEFVEGTGPTYPVHPEDPDTDGNEGPVGGSLAIVSVSDFYFGQIPVMASTQEYAIEPGLPNIQVVDLRGTATGWKVSASMTRFSDGTNPTLPGATILIDNGRPNASLENLSDPPVQKNVKLTADTEPATILTAAPGAGTGLWVMRWYPPGAERAYVHLEIPAGSATRGNHSAEINWILADAA